MRTVIKPLNRIVLLAPSDSIDNVSVMCAAYIPAKGRIKKKYKRAAIDWGINVK